MNNLVKSKLKNQNILILFIGSVAGIFFGIKFTIVALNNYAVLIVSIPFLLAGLVSFYYLLFFDVLYITKEKLIVKTFYGYTKKTILLSKILSYNEIEKENAKQRSKLAYMKWKDLTLFGDNFSYKISSSSYSNYEELKRALIRGKRRNHKSEKEWQRKNNLYYGIGFLIFGLVLCFWFGINSKDTEDIIITGVFSSFFIIYGIYLIIRNKNKSK